MRIPDTIIPQVAIVTDPQAQDLARGSEVPARVVGHMNDGRVRLSLLGQIISAQVAGRMPPVGSEIGLRVTNIDQQSGHVQLSMLSMQPGVFGKEARVPQSGQVPSMDLAALKTFTQSVLTLNGVSPAHTSKVAQLARSLAEQTGIAPQTLAQAGARLLATKQPLSQAAIVSLAQAWGASSEAKTPTLGVLLPSLSAPPSRAPQIPAQLLQQALAPASNKIMVRGQTPPPNAPTPPPTSASPSPIAQTPPPLLPGPATQAIANILGRGELSTLGRVLQSPNNIPPALGTSPAPIQTQAQAASAMPASQQAQSVSAPGVALPAIPTAAATISPSAQGQPTTQSPAPGAAALSAPSPQQAPTQPSSPTSLTPAASTPPPGNPPAQAPQSPSPPAQAPQSPSPPAQAPQSPSPPTSSPPTSSAPASAVQQTVSAGAPEQKPAAAHSQTPLRPDPNSVSMPAQTQPAARETAPLPTTAKPAPTTPQDAPDPIQQLLTIIQSSPERMPRLQQMLEALVHVKQQIEEGAVPTQAMQQALNARAESAIQAQTLATFAESPESPSSASPQLGAQLLTQPTAVRDMPWQTAWAMNMPDGQRAEVMLKERQDEKGRPVELDMDHFEAAFLLDFDALGELYLHMQADPARLTARVVTANEQTAQLLDAAAPLLETRLQSLSGKPLIMSIDFKAEDIPQTLIARPQDPAPQGGWYA